MRSKEKQRRSRKSLFNSTAITRAVGDRTFSFHRLYIALAKQVGRLFAGSEEILKQEQ